MKKLADELRIFFEETGIKPYILAKRSGVDQCAISLLLKGIRKGLRGERHDLLRKAMAEIREEEAILRALRRKRKNQHIDII